jgi:hypothetical protein
VVWLGIVEARVPSIGGLLVGFLGQWWHIVAEVVGGIHRFAVGGGMERVGFGYVVILVVRLPERMLLPLLLSAKNLDSVLELRESCSISVDVLLSSFSMLSCCLSSCDSFFFLMKALDFLLNSSQFLFFCSFVFKGFILLVFDSNLFELYILLDDLNW